MVHMNAPFAKTVINSVIMEEEDAPTLTLVEKNWDQTLMDLGVILQCLLSAPTTIITVKSVFFV